MTAGRGNARVPTAPAALVVAGTMVTMELLRVSFPLLYALAEDIGFMTAAGVIPALFAIPLLAAPLGLVVGPRAMAAAAGGLLGAARIVAQLQPTPTLAVALIGVVAGMVALPTAVRLAVARDGARAGVTAIVLGVALDTAVRLAFVTWDPAWQHGLPAMVVGIAAGIAAVAGAVGVARAPDAPTGADRVRPALVLGPVVALQTLVLANPGFVASSAGVSLAVAGVVVLVGLATIGVGPEPSGRAIDVVAGVVLVAVPALLAGPTGLEGPGVLVAVPAGQWGLGLLAIRALAAGPATDDRRTWRTGVGAGLGSLALVAGLLPYQISYELPLGIPNLAWPTAAAVLVAALALWPRHRQARVGHRPPRIPVAAMLALLAVPAWLAVTAPSAADPDEGSPTVRVATYNLHSGVGMDGRLDPERIAQVLADNDAEVMALQEVARGWPLAGGIDLAAWLQRRLGAELAYGPAADQQFGNAVLSTRPIRATRAATMERGEGTMRRGWVAATVPVADTTLQVVSTHLQHQDHTTATRRAQAGQVLAAWDGASRTIIAGDFNSRPGSPDIQPWFDGTGLRAAQDSVAGTPADTSPADAPDHRIDWILGTPDLSFADVVVPATTASDHLPVVADVTIDPA